MAASGAASTFHFQSSFLPKSQFLSQTIFPKSALTFPLNSRPPHRNHPNPTTTASFKLSEILGGRGLCNGEEGLQKELTKPTPESQSQSPIPNQAPSLENPSIPESSGDRFEKELMGLTGGFPGGERGLRKFIEENPPPRKKDGEAPSDAGLGFDRTKAKPPKLPLLLPGMIAIVKNPNNPFYMYCGIVQLITDGKAGVLFEGGNWDRLVTFRLEELERRAKGPPMVNPRSAIFEEIVGKD